MEYGITTIYLVLYEMVAAYCAVSLVVAYTLEHVTLGGGYYTQEGDAHDDRTI